MYCFANLCRFCKKSDNHFIDITSKMFREIIKIYNILCKDTDVELNTFLRQVCQTCFQILTNISDILLECNKTDNTDFRKYLTTLKNNDKSYANYEWDIKDQVIHYADFNQSKNMIKNEFVNDLSSPSTSNEYNENIIKTEVPDEYNDFNNLDERNVIDIIDELKVIPYMCRYCKRYDKHFIEVTSKMFREIRQIYNILSENTDVKLNMCLQQVCQICFKILTNISDILSECNRTDIFFKEYLAILQINDNSYAKCECIIKDEVIHYSDVNQCPNRIKIELLKDLNIPSTSSEYNIHKRIHTGNFCFECDVCTKKFNNKSNLIRHKRLHTGDLPFECDVCNKKFNVKGALINHKRIHTGERPFECDICNKKFGLQTDLNRHNLIHTGERPFVCGICNKKFNRKSHLNRHTRIHTVE